MTRSLAHEAQTRSRPFNIPLANRRRRPRARLRCWVTWLRRPISEERWHTATKESVCWIPASPSLRVPSTPSRRATPGRSQVSFAVVATGPGDRTVPTDIAELGPGGRADGPHCSFELKSAPARCGFPSSADGRLLKRRPQSSVCKLDRELRPPAGVVTDLRADLRRRSDITPSPPAIPCTGEGRRNVATRVNGTSAETRLSLTLEKHGTVPKVLGRGPRADGMESSSTVDSLEYESDAWVRVTIERSHSRFPHLMTVPGVRGAAAIRFSGHRRCRLVARAPVVPDT